MLGRPEHDRTLQDAVETALCHAAHAAKFRISDEEWTVFCTVFLRQWRRRHLPPKPPRCVPKPDPLGDEVDSRGRCFVQEAPLGHRAAPLPEVAGWLCCSSQRRTSSRSTRMADLRPGAL